MSWLLHGVVHCALESQMGLSGSCPAHHVVHRLIRVAREVKAQLVDQLRALADPLGHVSPECFQRATRRAGRGAGRGECGARSARATPDENARLAAAVGGFPPPVEDGRVAPNRIEEFAIAYSTVFRLRCAKSPRRPAGSVPGASDGWIRIRRGSHGLRGLQNLRRNG